MTVMLKLSCGGCDATAEVGPVRRRFYGVNGKDYGIGRYAIDPVEDFAPKGWVMFDPYTQCTYCPECWDRIENGGGDTEAGR